MMLMAVPALTSSPSQNGSSASKAAASIHPIMLGVDSTGGSSSRQAVRVFLNSTRFSTSPRVLRGTGLGMNRDYREGLGYVIRSDHRSCFTPSGAASDLR